jgi:hypothetical protein
VHERIVTIREGGGGCIGLQPSSKVQEFNSETEHLRGIFYTSERYNISKNDWYRELCVRVDLLLLYKRDEMVRLNTISCPSLQPSNKGFNKKAPCSKQEQSNGL